MRIWITRAEPGAQATAARVAALGHEPVVAPLIEVQALAGIDPGLEPEVGALAFTSAHAVRAFARLTSDRSRPAFAVGEATAAAARTAGFAVIAIGEAGAAALAQTIAGARGGFQGVVLHPCAAEPAGDLAGALQAAGLPARRRVVYETRAVEALPARVAAARPEAVMAQSPRAARALARMLPPDWAGAMEALALSPACAEPLAQAGFRRLAVAPFPNEAALLRLLAP